MGEIMKIHCNMCQAEWECWTGCGLQHGRKENIVAAFCPEEQAQVIEWLSNLPLPLYDFRYQTASCGICHKPVSVPVLRNVENDEIFVGVCPVCGNQPQMPLPESITDMACPACGSMSLEAAEAGHWD